MITKGDILLHIIMKIYEQNFSFKFLYDCIFLVLKQNRDPVCISYAYCTPATFYSNRQDVDIRLSANKSKV